MFISDLWFWLSWFSCGSYITINCGHENVWTKILILGFFMLSLHCHWIHWCYMFLCLFKSKCSKPLFWTKLIRHQQKMNLKCCQKSGLKVTVLLKNWGKRVNKEPFLWDSSVCKHHRNSVYEFGYQKLCELNLNYNSGRNFQIFFVIDMWWWLI